jgi:small subunit ribosomal protein S8e
VSLQCAQTIVWLYWCIYLQVAAKAEDAPKKSESAQRRLAARQKTRTLDPALDDQFASGRILACISSRPGQVSY